MNWVILGLIFRDLVIYYINYILKFQEVFADVAETFVDTTHGPVLSALELAEDQGALDLGGQVADQDYSTAPQ